jgi:hypothetical protein
MLTGGTCVSYFAHETTTAVRHFWSARERGHRQELVAGCTEMCTDMQLGPPGACEVLSGSLSTPTWRQIARALIAHWCCCRVFGRKYRPASPQRGRQLAEVSFRTFDVCTIASLKALAELVHSAYGCISTV